MTSIGSIIDTAQGLARVVAIGQTPVTVGPNALNNALAQLLGGGGGREGSSSSRNGQAPLPQTADAAGAGNVVQALLLPIVGPGASAASPGASAASVSKAAAAPKQQAASDHTEATGRAGAGLTPTQEKAINTGINRNVVDAYLADANVDNRANALALAPLMESKSVTNAYLTTANLNNPPQPPPVVSLLV